jgi:HEAT repeat protein
LSTALPRAETSGSALTKNLVLRKSGEIFEYSERKLKESSMSAKTPDIEVILSRMRVPGEDGLFILGCFERPATVYMQQVRALNLIFALSSARQSADTSIAIVGAGAAGITAAAAAAIHGWQVTVLERINGDVLSLAGSDASKRWLHPHIYDWPLEKTDEPAAGLCILDWTAGPADKVISELRLRWKQIESTYQIETHVGVTDVSINPLDGKYFVQWNGKGHRITRPASQVWKSRTGMRLRAMRFDLVILAVGFGKEESTSVFPNVSSYWAADNIDQNRDGSSRVPLILVSGTGDGGLIDTLRYSFKDFKHEEILDRLRNEWLDPQIFQNVQMRLRQIELEARSARASGKDYETQLNFAYRTLVDSLELRTPISLRQDVRVVLTGTSPFPLTLESAPINRFLFSLTDAQYVAGPVTRIKEKEVSKTASIWTVFFKNQEEPITFDEILIRHGPKSALQRWFPDVYMRCGNLIETARTMPDPTREPLYDSTFVAIMKTASDALATPYQRSDSAVIQNAIISFETDASQVGTFARYRTKLTNSFERKATFVQLEVARLAKDDLIFAGRQTTTERRWAERLDKNWLTTGAAVKVIMGTPGSGKTALNSLIHHAAEDATLFPLYVQARHLQFTKSDSFFVSAFDWCKASLNLDASQSEALRVVYLGRLLQGKVIAFLDGVDKIQADLRVRLINSLNEDSKGSFQRGNRLVLTTRFMVGLDSIPECEAFELLPLDSQQILELLSCRSSIDIEKQEAIATITKIPNVSDLLQSPQILQFLMQTPDNVLGEFENIYDLLEVLIQAVIPVTIDRPTRWVLGELALATFPSPLFTKHDIEASFANAAYQNNVDMAVERALTSSILVATEGQPNLYSFGYRLVQEFLAAEALAHTHAVTSMVERVFSADISEVEILPMAIGLLSDPTEAFSLLESLPDSVDYTVLRVRTRASRYRGHSSPEQAERLAVDIREVVANIELCPDDLLQRLSHAVLGMHKEVASLVTSHVSSLLHDSELTLRCRAIKFIAAAKLPGACVAITPSLWAEDDAVRKTAAYALGELGDVAAIPLLVRAFLTNGDTTVFADAADAIERIGGKQAVAALVTILSDKSLFRNFRWPAAQALGRLRDPVALVPLLEAIDDSAEIVRSHVVEALGQFTDRRAVAALITCLFDPEVSVRTAAADALGTARDPAAIDHLLKAMEDGHNGVKISAARALLTIAPADLIEPLRRAIADTKSTWRGYAAELLGKVLGTEALPTLLLISRDPDPDLRRGAASSLGEIPDARSVERLLEMSDDASEDVRYEAIDGLGKHPDSNVIPTLGRRLIEDDGNKVGLAAIRALRQISDPSSVEFLVLSVQSGGVMGRFAALALGTIGDETTIPVLASAWRRSTAGQFSVRMGFIEAIARIDGPTAALTLRELLSGEGELGRSNVMEACGTMKHPVAVPNLLVGLNDESALVRRSASSALYLLSRSQLVAGLLIALRDGHTGVRRQAVLICPYYADAQITKVLENFDRADLDANSMRELDSTLVAVRKKRSLRGDSSTDCKNDLEEPILPRPPEL